MTLLEPALDEPVAPRRVSPSVADPASPAPTLLAAELTDFLQEARQPPGHDRRRRHRIPPRPPRSGPAHPLVAQTRPPGAPGAHPAGVGAAVQVARRPHHPGPRPRRVPARPARDDRVGGGRLGGRPRTVPGAPRAPPRRRSSHPAAGAARGSAAAAARRLAGELSALADSARSADGAAWSAGALARAGVARAHRRVVRGGTVDFRLLATGRPARAAQAVQGAALRAGDVRAGARRRPGRQGGQGPQEPSGRAGSVPGLGGAADRAARVRAGDGRRRCPGRRPARHGGAPGSPLCQQRRARAEFATAFASYVRPSGRRRMAGLLGSAGKAAG